jgi:hypothetical protein
MLDRLFGRKNGNQEIELVLPELQVGDRTQCPFCPRKVKLNELVRSAYHVLGCRYCHGGA